MYSACELNSIIIYDQGSIQNVSFGSKVLFRGLIVPPTFGLKLAGYKHLVKCLKLQAQEYYWREVVEFGYQEPP